MASIPYYFPPALPKLHWFGLLDNLFRAGLTHFIFYRVERVATVSCNLGHPVPKGSRTNYWLYFHHFSKIFWSPSHFNMVVICIEVNNTLGINSSHLLFQKNLSIFGFLSMFKFLIIIWLVAMNFQMRAMTWKHLLFAIAGCCKKEISQCQKIWLER